MHRSEKKLSVVDCITSLCDSPRSNFLNLSFFQLFFDKNGSFMDMSLPVTQRVFRSYQQADSHTKTTGGGGGGGQRAP